MEDFWRQYSTAVYGGALIGTAAGLVLWLHGRVAGVSGMVGSLFEERTEESAWRAWFLMGLIAGGWMVSRACPAMVPVITLPTWMMMLAGFMVGLGARLGGGCTSGHGLCGMTLLNRTSILLTATFMGTGAVVVYIGRHVVGWGK